MQHTMHHRTAPSKLPVYYYWAIRHWYWFHQ